MIKKLCFCFKFTFVIRTHIYARGNLGILAIWQFCIFFTRLLTCSRIRVGIAGICVSHTCVYARGILGVFACDATRVRDLGLFWGCCSCIFETWLFIKFTLFTFNFLLRITYSICIILFLYTIRQFVISVFFIEYIYQII